MEVMYATTKDYPSVEVDAKTEEVRYAEPSKVMAKAAVGGDYEELYEAMSSARAYRCQNNSLQPFSKPEELSGVATTQFTGPTKEQKLTSVGVDLRSDKSKQKQPAAAAAARIVKLFAALLLTCFMVTLASFIFAAFTHHSYQQMLQKQESTESELASLRFAVRNLTEHNMAATVPPTASPLPSIPPTSSGVTTTESPLQPDWSCYTETVNTSQEQTGSNSYRKHYKTAEIATHVQVRQLCTIYISRLPNDFLCLCLQGYETVDTNCQFDSSHLYTVVTSMKHSGGRVQCHCDVFNFPSSQGSRSTLTSSSDFYLHCMLSITHCQLGQVAAQ